VLTFPEGATVIDFAYRIHSEVGQHCTGARVNGRLVPLRYQLRNEDTVEIITTANQTPSKDWLTFVKTSRAKQRIRNWIRYQQRSRSLAVGREILDRDLERYGLSLAALRKQNKLGPLLGELSQKDEEMLLASIGYGKITSHQVLSKLLPPDQLQKPREDGTLKRLMRMMSGQTEAGVRVGGVDDVLVRFGKCCEPLPGERILGFITRGRGVTVHAVDCPRVLDSDPQRRVEVVWEKGSAAPRAVSIDVVCIDETGILAAMSKAISSTGVGISRAQVRGAVDGRATNTFEIVVSDVDELNRVIRSLSKVRGIMRVARSRD